MGGLLSRAGTDTYYANYEKAFERLEKDSSKVLDRRVKRRKRMDACSNLGFWTTAVAFCVALLLTAYLQQVSTQKWYQKAVTILGAFAAPLVSALLFKGILWLFRFGEARDERFLRKLMEAKRKMIKDLKDSTRFERTAALIKKYDPDEQHAGSPRPRGPVQLGAESLRRRQVATAAGAASNSQAPSASVTPRTGALTPVGAGGALIRPAAAAASAAVSVATGTGKALMPVFESLANNLMGDNPVLVQEAHHLREENNVLKAKLAEIEARLAKVGGDEAPASPPAKVVDKASSG
ncbi:hypothetical protein Agub_g2054 [Astrephomene gubernaculifera]|uniref:Uncharacterized protein n=1 Tax=Astrephomene gubernaculifera TaxID=47775 RepID=A0AAD3DK59_9CHLO|nr:hypothetical protein Agub_g2054 [Astrephomene gubernaculifera]